VKVSSKRDRINFLGSVFNRFISLLIEVQTTKVRIYFHKANLVA
jgi:hypothetical protein